MPTEVIMPQMGESIFEGTITKWFKAVGDAIAIDEPLFEISTDKVDAEIPSPVAGVLAEIRFPEGATVEVNTVVAVIGESGAKIAGPAPAAKAGAPQVAPKAQAIAAQPPAENAGQSQAAEAPTGRIRSSPLARRIAKEHGVELSRIAGSGSEGRVTKEDVLRAASSPSAAKLPVQRPAANAVAAECGAGTAAGAGHIADRACAADPHARHHCRAHAREREHQPSRLQPFTKLT
ncbi:MAG: biotin/lipoyl-containing protein [Terracidiphilus sp.]